MKITHEDLRWRIEALFEHVWKLRSKVVVLERFVGQPAHSLDIEDLDCASVLLRDLKSDVEPLFSFLCELRCKEFPLDGSQGAAIEANEGSPEA